MNHPDLMATIEQKKADLAGQGRVLIRASGTEHLIRIMVECTDVVIMKDTVDALVALVNDIMEQVT